MVASAVPAGITGTLFADVMEEKTGAIWLSASMLVVFGLVLAWADRQTGDRPIEQVTLRDALIMGTGQALALQPGVSRSGAPMTAGRFPGLRPAAAARLPFLLTLPHTAGAPVFQAVAVAGAGGVPAGYYARSGGASMQRN